MIEKTETSFHPDYISIPGETLQDILDAKNMKQVELAKRTGRPVKTINEIIKGHTSITPETALQFEKVLGTPAFFWNNREKRYRELLSKRNERKALYKNKWLNNFPVKELIQYGWIKECKDQVEQVVELLKFYGVASPVQWKELWTNSTVTFRQSLAFKSNPHAVSAWLRQGEIKAHEIKCADYNIKTFKKVLNQIRLLTLQDLSKFVPKLKELCASAGVSVVFLQELKKTRLSGAVRWLSSSKALIQLSLRYLSNDNLWFSFFHEAGHIIYNNKKTITLEDINTIASSKHEEKINKFARDFLIPKKNYQAFIKTNNITINTIKQFAKTIYIAPGIVVGRLQHDKHLPYKKFNSIKVKYEWIKR